MASAVDYLKFQFRSRILRGLLRISRRFLRSALESSPSLFCRIFRHLSAHTVVPDSTIVHHFDPKHEQRLNDTCMQLQENGLALCEQALDASQVGQLSDLLHHVLSRSPSVLSGSKENENYIEDKELGCQFSRSGVGADNGRTRATFRRENVNRFPVEIRSLFEEKFLQELVSRYLGVYAECSYVLLERFEPCSDPNNHWHVDTLFDQVKVMIILNDVTKENGPLRYKLTSHKLPRLMDPHFYHTFKSGLMYAYPGLNLVAQLPGDIAYSLGHAGDAFIFDTLGVHSGTICRERERNAIVMNFRPSTRKNRFLWSLGMRS